jgi:IS5 family transposase
MQECCMYGSMRGALGQLASLPQLVDGNYPHSASPAEVKLAETTLATIRVGRSHHAGRPRQKPMRVIADKAYHSDPLRERLRQRGIELICPHKRNRVRPAAQDGRVLRRHQRRWIVERSNAWLGNFHACLYATTVRSRSMVLFFMSPAS